MDKARAILRLDFEVQREKAKVHIVSDHLQKEQQDFIEEKQAFELLMNQQVFYKDLESIVANGLDQVKRNQASLEYVTEAIQKSYNDMVKTVVEQKLNSKDLWAETMQTNNRLTEMLKGKTMTYFADNDKAPIASLAQPLESSQKLYKELAHAERSFHQDSSPGDLKSNHLNRSSFIYNQFINNQMGPASAGRDELFAQAPQSILKNSQR